MHPVLALIFSVISAYLIGSFPTSFILTKMLKGIDIRDAGSKNAGATNVLRTVGKMPALVTLIADILKGVLAVTVVADFFYQFDIDLVYDFYRGLLGFVAVAGHVWPVFLRFKGGKGVATTLGVAGAIAPLILMPSLAVWLAIFFLTNYVSLASITAFIVFPIFSAIFNPSLYTTIFSVAICSLVIYKHKSNIERLLKGTENKTILFKPKS